jgi:hypothetical protein
MRKNLEMNLANTKHEVFVMDLKGPLLFHRASHGYLINGLSECVTYLHLYT